MRPPWGIRFQKLALKFVYFLFFINIYIIIKDNFLDLNSSKKEGLFYIFKNMIRYYLYYISLALLIKQIYKKEIYNFIIVGVKYAVVTIAISMVFTKALILIGAGVSFASI